MREAAAGFTTGSVSARTSPLSAPPAILEAQREHDWDAVLPAQAGTFGYRFTQRVKRLLDVVLSALGLIILSPLLLATALIVKATSRGPILYAFHVVGRRARPFVTYKFRTMVVNADELKALYLAQNEMTGPVFKMRNDPRVTRPGRFLRKYSIDELPQLWSVLKGDMSLVGPRAPGLHEFEHFEPWQRSKLSVTPGITCLWQCSGRSNISSFDEWVRLDLQYIREWSLLLDLKILLRTIPVVLRGHGAY